MLVSHRTALVLTVAALLSGACSTPSAAPPHLEHHDHSWANVQAFESGVQIDTSIQTCEHVTLPETGELVRPLAVHVQFKHGLAVWSEIKSMKLYPVDDVTPLVFDIQGFDTSDVLDLDPSREPLRYEVTLTPRAGYSWGTVRRVRDVRVVVVERALRDPIPAEKMRPGFPVGA